MPGFDRSGPGGRGPATGWGRGGCSPVSAGRRLRPFGAMRGIGRGGVPWGGGRGRCFGGRGWWGPSAWQVAPVTDEAELLRNELAAARDEIAAMEARLSELDKKQS